MYLYYNKFLRKKTIILIVKLVERFILKTAFKIVQLPHSKGIEFLKIEFRVNKSLYEKSLEIVKEV